VYTKKIRFALWKRVLFAHENHLTIEKEQRKGFWDFLRCRNEESNGQDSCGNKRRNELMEASRLHVGVTCHVPHWTWSEITNRLLSHECCSATFPDFQIDFFDPIDIMASPYHRQSPGKSVCQCNCRLEFKAPHYCNVNIVYGIWYSSERWGVWRVLREQDPPRVLSLSTSPHPAFHINDKRRSATFEVAKHLCCFVFLSSALLKLFNICWILFCRVNCKAN
jgi:hypothetical protein